MSNVSRRSLVAGLVGGTLLAGCLGDDGDDSLEIPPPEDDDASDSSDDDPDRWEHDATVSLGPAQDGVIYGIEDFQQGSGGVIALDVETGTVDWRYGETGGYTTFTEPTLADGIYVGFGDDAFGSESGSLHALDLDGEERFSIETASIYDPPVVADGTVFVAGDDQRVRAVDPDAGDECWTTEIDDVGEPASPSIVAVTDDWLAVTEGETLRTLEVETGEVRWQFAGEAHAITAEESAYDDAAPLFVGTDEGVTRVDEDAVTWDQDLGPAPTVYGTRRGTLFVGHEQTLYGLDPEEGSARWTTTIPVHRLTLGGAGVFVVTENGAVTHVDDEGETVFERSLDVESGAEIRSLEQFGDTVYAIGEDEIHGVGRSGEREIRTDLTGARDLWAGDRIVVATDEQTIGLESLT